MNFYGKQLKKTHIFPLKFSENLYTLIFLYSFVITQEKLESMSYLKWKNLFFFMVQKFLEYLIQFPIKSSKYFNNAACNAKSPKNIFSEVCHLDIENRGIRLVFEKKKMWSLSFLTV